MVYDITRRSTYNHLSSWLTDARNLTNPNTVRKIFGIHLQECNLFLYRELCLWITNVVENLKADHTVNYDVEMFQRKYISA